MASRHTVSTTAAPPAIGPYSQAVVTEGFVFCSGQIPLDPTTGQVVEGDIRAQTHRVIQNLRAVLEAAQSGLDKVVKTTVFLQDMNDFAAMNSVYSEYFAVNPPARSTVQVSQLPRGVLIEIECIAIR